MALTRAFLKSMTLTDEQISAIIEEHSATVTGLKGEISKYKEDAEKVPDLQKKLEDYEKENWKGKYEKEHADFEGYKTEQDKKHPTMQKKPHTKDARRFRCVQQSN